MKLRKDRPPTPDPAEIMAQQEAKQKEEKKRGLGGLFGKKKDKDAQQQHQQQPNTIGGTITPPPAVMLNGNDTSHNATPMYGVGNGGSGQQQQSQLTALHGMNSNSTAMTPAHDSAYASSNPSSSQNGSSNFVPVQNNGQISGVDGDRGLALNRLTGDVVDDQTGGMYSCSYLEGSEEVSVLTV
jgi:hypothetical protein